MRTLKAVFLVVGIALLALILWRTDLTGVGELLLEVGAAGFAAVLLIYLVETVLDARIWQLALPSAGPDGRWLKRLFDLRVVGEAFNTVTPALSFGGEPLKALLLRQCYGIGYHEGAASLVVAKTVAVVTLVPFLAIGYAFIVEAGVLSPAHNSVIGTSLALLSAGILGFLGVQRLRLISRLGAALGRRRLGRWLARVLGHLEDVDARFVEFYAHNWPCFMLALALAFGNWVLGVLEVYVTMIFLGHPVSFAEAWCIEAAAQLVRAATFYIPASLGAQEGAFLIVGAFFTGSPVSAIALAAVRRARELVWVVWGLAIYYRVAPEGRVDAQG